MKEVVKSQWNCLKFRGNTAHLKKVGRPSQEGYIKCLANMVYLWRDMHM